MKTVVAILLIGFVSLAFSNKDSEQIKRVISAIEEKDSTTNNSFIQSSPNSFVSLDFSIETGESWDSKDQAKNVIVNCINGDKITGFEYSDVLIQTEGDSFFSEAVIYFSDSNNGDDGLRLTIGAGNESPGTAVFSSNGILDITDSGNEDVSSLEDNQFNIQFYEKIDDAINSIDARFIDGNLKIWGVDLVAVENCPFVAASQESDLSIAYIPSQMAPSYIGEPIEFDIRVANSGAALATNVVLENKLSSKLHFTNMSCDDGTDVSDVNDILALNVQDIAPNSELNCIIFANIIANGAINNSITVSSTNDNNVVNNSIGIIINGVALVIPVNNVFGLLLLILFLIFFAKKTLKATA